MFPRPDFFLESTLNFAENLLYPSCDPDPQSLAIIAATESTRESVTWSDLRNRVSVCAAAMRSHGLQPHDRVVGLLANHTNTVVAMLAATSIGAVWSGVSPDTGVEAILDRLTQIEPVILLADNAVTYNGKTHETHQKISAVASSLPSLKSLVIFDTVPAHSFDTTGLNASESCKVETYAMFVEDLSADKSIKFEHLPPDHPIYILYSSGTTGAPKAIVHGALGTLIQHKKEHLLHCDFRPGDRFFYFTTCTWMMW